MTNPKVRELIPNALEWRCVGPFRGGRVVAVAGDVSNPMVFYFGCAGGVWKTNDGGTYWENVSDGFFKTSAVGAIAVSESDPNVIYAGMGESCTAVPRLHWTSRADGMYRSTDAGRSWVNIGLEDTRYIARIRGSSEQPRPGLRRRPRPSRRPRHPQGRLPLRRRRAVMGARPVPQRERRMQRPMDGSDQPPRHLRRDLGLPPQLLELVQRRPRQPNLSQHGRRRHLDRPHRQPRPSRSYQGAHRRNRNWG